MTDSTLIPEWLNEPDSDMDGFDMENNNVFAPMLCSAHGGYFEPGEQVHLLKPHGDLCPDCAGLTRLGLYRAVWRQYSAMLDEQDRLHDILFAIGPVPPDVPVRDVT